MNAPSVDIKDILDQDSSQNIGTFATDIFVSAMPDTPNACVCIYDTGPWKKGETNFTLWHPTIQILVRGAVGGYVAAYNKAADVVSVLHTITNEIWGSTKYHGIWCNGDILSLGYDEEKRPLLSINFHIMRSA